MKVFRRATILIFIACLILPLAAFGAEKTKVAIIPFKINSPEKLDYLEGAIYDMIASRLSVDENVAVLERSTVVHALGKDYETSMTVDNAEALGKRLGADYVILGSLTKLGEAFSIDAKMFSVAKKEQSTAVYAQGSGLDALIPKINEFARNMNFKILGYIPKEGVAGYMGEQVDNPNFIFATRDLMSKSDFRKSPFWDIQIKGVDVGDVDGDGVNECVVIDRNGMWVYKRGKEEFELFATFKGRGGDNFLTVDVLDLNRNGKAEVFITNVTKGRLASLVVEYDAAKKAFVRIDKNIPLFFRAFKLPGKETLLLCQKMGMDTPFYRGIHKVEIKRGGYVEGLTVDFPEGLGIFGVTLPANLTNEDVPEIAHVTDSNHLEIRDTTGTVRWMSKDYWGGTLNYYSTARKEEMKPGGGSADLEAGGDIYITGRVFITDLNHDNIMEVLVPKNISKTMNLLPKFRLYETSEIYNLQWDGINMSENWRSRLIDGYVADFQIKDIDSDGIDELVVAVVYSQEMTALIPAKSGVLIYELSF
jgi:TolB-like protein